VKIESSLGYFRNGVTTYLRSQCSERVRVRTKWEGMSRQSACLSTAWSVHMRTQHGRGQLRGRASGDRPSRRHKLAERAQRNLLQQVIIEQATGHTQLPEGACRMASDVTPNGHVTSC
jgi:hypothetical protein